MYEYEGVRNVSFSEGFAKCKVAKWQSGKGNIRANFSFFKHSLLDSKVYVSIF